MTTPTKVLDLRGLSATERDARVTIAISGLAGWRTVRNNGAGGGFFALSPDGQTDYSCYGSEQCALAEACPPYATSCDAVTPLLEKWSKTTPGYVHWNFLMDAHRVWLEKDPFTKWDAIAATFPLAACYALLRANGWEVLT